MKKQDFINIYKELSPEIKCQIDEKLDDIKDLENLLMELNERINRLSPQERDDLEKDETEFINQSNIELQEIESTDSVDQNAESREEDRAIEIINHQNYLIERLKSEYPKGIEILNDDINIIYKEIYKLIPN